MQVLFGLEYAHALPAIGVALTTESMRSHGPKSGFEIHYADVFSSVINPEAAKTTKGQLKVNDNQYESECLTGKTHREYRIGGLVWSLPEDHRMEDYLLFWIGADDAAFSNVVITFNSSEIGKSFHDVFSLELCLKFLPYIHIYFTLRSKNKLISPLPAISSVTPLHLSFLIHVVSLSRCFPFKLCFLFHFFLFWGLLLVGK